jgi:hypothetical protein
MLPTVEMRFRPLKNIHARCIPDAFSRQREPWRSDHGMPDQRRVRPKVRLSKHTSRAFLATTLINSFKAVN